jgi:hypothetical protein
MEPHDDIAAWLDEVTDLGFTVTAPSGGVPEARMETLVHW